jgi:beta-glucosidase
MRNYLISLLIFLPFFTTAQSKDTFIKDLMQKMTLEEKLGQLNLVTGGEATTGSVVSTDVETKIIAGQVGGIFSLSTPQKIRQAQELAMKSRLKIPILFGMDVIHGYRTVFPIPLGLASSWDLDLIQKSAQVAAGEATADGIAWTFSPMVDICRDPRWGRVAETSGEDPYLGSRIGEAMVKGYQGDGKYKDNKTMLACVKHFALYGASEAGRDYNTTDMSRIRMYNEYLPPYKAALDAGAGSIMASFNDIDGIPATANPWLLTDLLRKDWGFKGLVVSDYTGVSEMIAHGLGDLQKVSAKALKAGTDMDMVSEGYLTTLKKSVDQGTVNLEEIDRACRLILEAKYDLGLFQDPFKYCDEQRAKTDIYNDKTRAFAREAATKSFVLLKNKNNILPLNPKNKIALIGPLVDNKENMGGTWSVSEDRNNSITLLQGLKNQLSHAQIVSCRGANIYSDPTMDANAALFGKQTDRDNRSDEEMLNEAVNLAKNADVIVAALGESAEMSGEASSRSKIDIPKNQLTLLKALVATGKPVVLVLFTGRPLTLNWENEHVDAILNVWFAGTEAGNAIADVLYGKVNPSGKLPITFPRNEGQIPIYYAMKNTGRPHSGNPGFEKFRSNYLDVENTPLFPFGFGLSYTTFTYGSPQISKTTMKHGEQIEVTVTVSNTGNYDGEEVVQLYIRDIEGSVTRPVKELKDFKKVLIKKGETSKVHFTIDASKLGYFYSDLKFKAESGEYEIMTGPNSAETQSIRFYLQ